MCVDGGHGRDSYSRCCLDCGGHALEADLENRRAACRFDRGWKHRLPGPRHRRTRNQCRHRHSPAVYRGNPGVHYFLAEQGASVEPDWRDYDREI